MTIQELLRRSRPVHPGEVLREDFLAPLAMTVEQLSKALDLSAAAVEDIVSERSGITSDAALRLGRYFNTMPSYWLSFQTRYNLKLADQAARHLI